MSLSLDLKVERESQFNTAGGCEFQVRGAAVLNDRPANDGLRCWRPLKRHIIPIGRLYGYRPKSVNTALRRSLG